MNEATIASLTILTGDYKCACCCGYDWCAWWVCLLMSVCVCMCVRGGGLYTCSLCCCVQRIHLFMCLPVFLQLGDYISDIASNMMLVEEHILWMAQNEARACTRIVQCVERIADLALAEDNQVISKVWLDFETATRTLAATVGQGKGWLID